MGIDDTEVTSKLFKIFDLWHLTTEQKLGSLGLSIDGNSSAEYIIDSEIYENKEMRKLAESLLLIHVYLNLLFPENPELANCWMNTRNRAFNGKKPIEEITVMGLPGVIEVLNYLEATLCG